MKLLQYLILSILIANGSLPIAQNFAQNIGNELLIQLLGTAESEDCNDLESESEDASEDDLVHPENHTLLEPKPHDTTNQDFSAEIKLQLSPSETTNYLVSDWYIIDDNKHVQISRKLLRQVYFSKRKTDLS